MTTYAAGRAAGCAFRCVLRGDDDARREDEEMAAKLDTARLYRSRFYLHAFDGAKINEAEQRIRSGTDALPVA
jgi:hypothetical protein